MKSKGVNALRLALLSAGAGLFTAYGVCTLAVGLYGASALCGIGAIYFTVAAFYAYFDVQLSD